MDQERLTQEDIDKLVSMMIIYFNCAERMVQMIELAYDAKYRTGDDYKLLVKRVGKVRANLIVKEQVQKVVRGEERMKIGRLLKLAQELHKTMESLNDIGMEGRREDVTLWDCFGAIREDVNYLCYLYALMANCKNESDSMQILSFVRRLAVDDSISERILTRLREPLNLLHI